MPGGTNNTPYYFVALAVLVMAIVLIVLAKKYAILRKPLAIVTIMTLAIVIGAYVFWSNEASINYWLMTERDYPVGDNHLDVTCENVGHLAGTINLKLQLTNAQFINTTSSSSTQVDSQTDTFTFTLHPGETQSAKVYFSVGASVTDFYFCLSFQQSGGNFLVKAEPGGVTSTSYQRDTISYAKDAASDNFTQRTVAPPP